ncbi:F0F1 ATP synthase subunit B [bacterium]|nr:F0F1 ATP synthase subunit B [bacterium]MBU1983697.1 F0F1 ATP synthase subunit B [bacterium]
MGFQNVLSIEPGSIIWTIVTFLVVAWLIGKFGWKPILSGLKVREESIRRDLETARAERERSSALLAEYQMAITNAKKESAEIIQKAQESASEVMDSARAESKELSLKMIERAKSEIERDTDAARTELKKYVADLTARAAARLIGRTVDAKEHEQLILDALREDR